MAIEEKKEQQPVAAEKESPAPAPADKAETATEAETKAEAPVVPAEAEAKPAAKPTPKAAPAKAAAGKRQRATVTKKPRLAPPHPKSDRISEMQLHGKDVGSTEVQIGLLTDRIKHLTAHLKIHPKDNHTNYGLRKLVSQRKRLLNYLSHSKPNSHQQVKATLGMR